MNQAIIYPLATVLLISSVFDIQYQKIPNWVTFTAMVIGLTLNGTGSGLDGILHGLAGIALGIGIFLIPYAMGGMGAGDAKLMGAVGSFLGAGGVFISALFTMAFGGLYAVSVMLLHRQYGKEILSSFKDNLVSLVLTQRFTPSSKNSTTNTADKPRLCYGVAIAAGTFIYMIMEASGYRFLAF